MSIFRKNKEEKKSKFFIREYKIIKQIGEGTYATIYKVQKDNSNEIYVLKQIHITDEDLNDTQSLNDIKNESLILSKIHSPYIVKFYDSFFHKNCLNIITEYCSAGDLCDYLQIYISHKKKMSEKLIWKLFIQICLGLYYLHQHKILHRDIKTKNIFLNEDFTIKIGDLGIAKILENTSSYAHTFIGTPYYLSPELCKDLPYNDKSDVWSLGCVLYEMVTLRHPFEGKTKVEIYEKIINSNYEVIDKHYSLELRRIIDLLLIKDEKKRPKIREILSLNIIKEKARESGIKVPDIKLKNSSRSNHNHHSNNHRNNHNFNTNNISNTNNSNNNSKNNFNNNSKNNFNSNNNSKNNFNNNNNYGSNCSSGNFNNNVNESVNKENNQKKIKISSVEVNYFKYKNEKNNENKEKKQNIQVENSGKNISKMIDISSILKQSQDKILNMLSKRKNNSKESFLKDNKEIYNYNNRNNERIQDVNINNQEQMNLNKNSSNNNKRAISGNSSKRNYISSQYYENNSKRNEKSYDKNIVINEIINQNSRNENSEYYNSYNSNSNINNNNNNNYSNKYIQNNNKYPNQNIQNNNNNFNQNIQNNNNRYLNNNLNELNKKNHMNHIINYNNNIKIQSNSNNNKIRKYLTDSKEKEINKSNENSNNEINSSIKNVSNINISNGHGKDKLQNQKIPLIINLDDKKKSNVHEIIKKIKQNPIKRNIEINNQQIKNKSNVKIEEIISQKNDSNNFTLTENKDMLLFNTNASDKSNMKMNEEKVKVFNANDTLINKTESQLKKDTISLLNLKKKYLSLLNESKNDMIEISNEVFENVFKIYKKLDSNPDNIDKIYDEIQNYMIEKIPQSNDNENNLYKKFNKAFSNYIFYEIELKDIDKKIEKRKKNSKWYIN